MSEDLLVERDGAVATVTMNRPDKMNALNLAIMKGLPLRIAELRDDPAIRCVVLTAAGDRAFSAGGDLKDVGGRSAESPILPAEGEPIEAPMARLRAYSEVSCLLHEMPKPTLAALNGVAAGASLSIALACDLRIASDTASLTTAFASMGFSGDFGGSYFMTQLVGTAKARELYLLGERIDAAEALRLGLVNWVAPADELRKRTQELAQRLAAGAPIAQRYMKRNLNLALKSDIRTMVDLECEAMVRTGNTEDFQGAVRAFVKKETAVFKGI